MKKLLFLSMAALFAISATNVTASVISHSPESGYSYSIRKVTVYKYGHGTLKITNYGGKYDSDSNMLIMGGDSYPVHNNPYYGTNDRRGEYPYKAGDWYFEL